MKICLNKKFNKDIIINLNKSIKLIRWMIMKEILIKIIKKMDGWGSIWIIDCLVSYMVGKIW